MKKKREANFELLRIVAMFMVVTLHYLSHTNGLLTLDQPAGGVQIFGQALESLCIVSVNVYILISGYFLSGVTYSVRRILTVVGQVLFYTVGVSFVMLVTGAAHVTMTDSIYKAVQFLLPLESEHYWFATAYVVMILFSPLLNVAVEKLSRRQLKITIAGLLFWFSLVRSFVPVNLVTDDYGYGFGWFICLYLIAAYIRRYEVPIFRTALSSLLVYLGCALVIFLTKFLIYLMHSSRGGLLYYFTMPDHYNFVFCLLGALGLFSLVRFLSIREGRAANLIRRIAPFTFGVYLLHEHLEIRDRWVIWMESIIGKVPASIPLFFLHLLVSVGLVYLAGIFVDWIRSIFFDFLRRILRKTRIPAALAKLDIDV